MGGGTTMSPEVEAAIIRVSGEWAMEMAKELRIREKNLRQFLSDSFKWAYDTLSSGIGRE
jgi:hypothetical protein